MERALEVWEVRDDGQGCFTVVGPGLDLRAAVFTFGTNDRDMAAAEAERRNRNPERQHLATCDEAHAERMAILAESRGDPA